MFVSLLSFLCSKLKVQCQSDPFLTGFSEAEELVIRNSRFYARGRFEEKANEAGIPLWTVPAANEASTVLPLDS